MEYTKDNLQRLITDQIEEGGELEYKAAKALTRDEGKTAELTKDISAFANAAGGVLIYGIAEFDDKARRHLPERLDPVDQTQFSREWLDQKIGLIRPRIEGLKITPVHVGPSVSDYCYVVEVPQSGTAHQARDFRYYRRRSFEVTPMEDYEVRDVMGRRSHPKVKVTIILAISLDPERHQLVCNLENISSVMARSVYCEIEVPLQVKGRHLAFEQASLVGDDESTIWLLRVSNSGDRPLFPGSQYSQSFTGREIGGPPRRKDASGLVLTSAHPCIRTKVFADEMPFIEESFALDDVIVQTGF